MSDLYKVFLSVGLPALQAHQCACNLSKYQVRRIGDLYLLSDRELEEAGIPIFSIALLRKLSRRLVEGWKPHPIDDTMALPIPPDFLKTVGEVVQPRYFQAGEKPYLPAHIRDSPLGFGVKNWKLLAEDHWRSRGCSDKVMYKIAELHERVAVATERLERVSPLHNRRASHNQPQCPVALPEEMASWTSLDMLIAGLQMYIPLVLSEDSVRSILIKESVFDGETFLAYKDMKSTKLMGLEPLQRAVSFLKRDPREGPRKAAGTPKPAKPSPPVEKEESEHRGERHDRLDKYSKLDQLDKFQRDQREKGGSAGDKGASEAKSAGGENEEKAKRLSRDGAHRSQHGKWMGPEKNIEDIYNYPGVADVNGPLTTAVADHETNAYQLHLASTHLDAPTYEEVKSVWTRPDVMLEGLNKYLPHKLQSNDERIIMKERISGSAMLYLTQENLVRLGMTEGGALMISQLMEKVVHRYADADDVGNSLYACYMPAATYQQSCIGRLMVPIYQGEAVQIFSPSPQCPSMTIACNWVRALRHLRWDDLMVSMTRQARQCVYNRHEDLKPPETTVMPAPSRSP